MINEHRNRRHELVIKIIIDDVQVVVIADITPFVQRLRTTEIKPLLVIENNTGTRDIQAIAFDIQILEWILGKTFLLNQGLAKSRL